MSATEPRPDVPVAGSAADAARPSNRRALLAAAAVIAAGAGAGTAMRRLGPAADGPDQGGGDVPAEIWARALQSPQGSPLPLAALRGRPMFINFWAPWCAPCVRELPRLSATATRGPGARWQWLAWAVDRPEAVAAFLRRTPVALPVGLDAGGMQPGMQAMAALGNPSGGLPFSLLVGPAGQVLARHLGEIHEPVLARWLAVNPG